MQASLGESPVLESRLIDYNTAMSTGQILIRDNLWPEQIRETITHPRIWDWITDDYSPIREQYRSLDHPSVHYVGAWDGETADYLGLFMLTEQSGVCWEVHTCLLPKAHGRSVEICKAGQRWVWANTRCERIVTTVPEYNRLALRLAIKAGMVQFGINPNSWAKGGRLHQTVLLGIGRPKEAEQCQQQ